MLIIGTLVSAFVMAPVLNLLLEAYGIGPQTPAHPDSLTAPQATLMASVARGVFRGGLPWTMVFTGMALGVAIIAFDLWLERHNARFRAPVLAVAVGTYLPFELATPILVGGLVAHFAARAVRRRGAWKIPEAAGAAGAAGDPPLSRADAPHAPPSDDPGHRGMLIASGLITGEALVGIGMAVPIVVAQRADVLAFWGVHNAAWPGVVVLAGIIYALYRVAARPV
jgi:uncharacterized oligopeptide transporter (OPT) family protein